MVDIKIRSVYAQNLDYPHINVTTSGGTKGRQLSPMLLGPVDVWMGLTENYIKAKNVENAWQFSKVYECHDTDGIPNKEWYAWRDKGFNDSWAHRYPMGKGAIPLYSWDGNQRDYIDARKLIYVPLYKDAVWTTKSELVYELVDMAVEHGQLTLQDYDVWPKNQADGLSFEEIINNPTVKMGHAYVLAEMIKEEINA